MGWEMDWINHRARISPDSTAIVESENHARYTYNEMNERANRLAQVFLSNGIQKGDRVALLSPNHICYFDLLFACGKIGAIFVPLNWRLAKSELSYILTDCTPALIAVHSTLTSLIDTTEQLTMIVDSSEYEYHVNRNFTSNLTKIEVTELDPLAIIYTGGTTGKPKGVVLTHQSILWNGINTIVSWNLKSEDITLTYLPMFHTGGLNALSIPILMMGGSVIIGSQFDPRKAMDIINQEGCTIVLMVPTMYHMMINDPLFNNITFPSMHTFLSGGAPCPLEIYKAFEKKKIVFKEGYGLTEAGPNNFFMDPIHTKDKRGSVGKPMMFNQIKLINDEGRETFPDEVGELLIKGKHVFLEYWNNEEASKNAKQNQWLYTGDLARKDSEGFHYIVGRKKEMIITGGENVYPLEVEQCLNQHPGVDEVAVIGITDSKWGEVVTAVLSLKETANITTEELKQFCGRSLGGYKVPRHFIIIDSIPKTHVGKIDKNALKEIYKYLEKN
ncbi:acyl-CoA synthetase [Litchfieldia alkalitelluris]|uniref:acyl-CoA synthetase n=1 Tax=Litchfieldia alkalitelluris TaxID=304268 RepID=UPI000997D9BD|nr:long-chain fatty acid--CoA ligase [Litchfieldia alkalitelluris]